MVSTPLLPLEVTDALEQREGSCCVCHGFVLCVHFVVPLDRLMDSSTHGVEFIQRSWRHCLVHQGRQAGIWEPEHHPQETEAPRRSSHTSGTGNEVAAALRDEPRRGRVRRNDSTDLKSGCAIHENCNFIESHNIVALAH